MNWYLFRFFNRIVVFPCKWKRREKMQLTLEASKKKEFTRSLVGEGGVNGTHPFYFWHNSSDCHENNKLHLYFQLSETTLWLIGFHGNNSQINDVKGGCHLGFWNFQILFKFSLLYFKMTRKQHLAVEINEMVRIHLDAKNWDFAVNTQIAWIFTMTSSIVTLLNWCQKMCSQTRNSCAKPFDNRSRGKNLKPKKSRGWGQFDSPPQRLLGLTVFFKYITFFYLRIERTEFISLISGESPDMRVLNYRCEHKLFIHFFWKLRERLPCQQ